jgi:hypothetical protein
MERFDSVQLRNKLVEVLLLLIGLYIFQGILPLTLPFVPINKLRTILIESRNWIGHIIFGIILLSRSKNVSVAMQVALLAVLTPVYGAIFFLIAETQKNNKNG